MGDIGFDGEVFKKKSKDWGGTPLWNLAYKRQPMGIPAYKGHH